MNLRFRRFQDGDFEKIQSFIVRNYNKMRGYNWTIESLSFSLSVSRILRMMTIQEIERQIGIWENKNGEITAIVNSTSGNSGKVFFQQASNDIPEKYIREMFSFADKTILPLCSETKQLQLRIFNEDTRVKSIAKELGYRRTGDSEIVLKGKTSEWEFRELPKGFTIKSGNEISDLDKGMAHANAFEYWREPKAAIAPLAYEVMKRDSFYNPELDLYVTNDKGEVVSFCTLWMDQVNGYGTIEPAGTHYNYRKRGLAAAVISEAVKRVANLGGEVVYVGSDQQFYYNLGFKKKYETEIWMK